MLVKLLLTFSLTAFTNLAAAQPLTGTPADHEALSAIKAKALEAVNAKDYGALKAQLHDPFMATVVTQDSFTDFDKMKAYFEDLFTRPLLRLKDVKFTAEADDYSTIFTGTIALTKGSDVERYEMADGRSFDMKGRWTAVSVKEADGQWKLAAIHMGTNFLDNPVLSAVEESIAWFGLGGAGAGLLGGLTAGYFLGRRRNRLAGTT